MAVRSFTLLFLLTSLVTSEHSIAQKKADRKTAGQLRADIGYLASDELEGRRTGTPAEVKAALYIEERYKAANIPPYKSQYRIPFHFDYGKEIAKTTAIRINNNPLKVSEDVFPLPFSASRHVNNDVLPEVMEQGSIWLMPVFSDKDQAENPHFEVEKHLYEAAKEAEKQGATGVLFYDAFDSKYAPTFNKHSEYDAVGIPLAVISYKAYQKYINTDKKGSVQVELNIQVNKAERSSNNIAAYIDNKAPYTVIIGAHYDHLGYGEDGNSLHANAVKEHQIHHGADDNASGTAAVLEMARWVKKKKLHHYNYLFLNFSGEELGLYGSKAFVKDQHIDSTKFAYMINMDMVGRLNDSTHHLEVGGIGTSPAWADVADMAGKDFKVSLDSSGVGPSDHTSFYHAGVPVLFFFTGSHKDYHKPSDKADLINYPGEVAVIKYVERVVAKMDQEEIKPTYTVTRQNTVGRVNFKVTLGIMPDYTYETGGVRVDGLSDNRPAIKAGIKQGDIITKLGDIKIMGMQTYMEALGKFRPGDKTQVTITRDGKEMVLPIEMNK